MPRSTIKDVDMPVLLGALAVATEQNQRALGKLLADTRFEGMFELPAVINPMEAAVAEAQGKLMEWKSSDRDYSRYYCDDASAYLTEIAESVPAAKPAEEEPAQSRSPKH